MKTIHKLIFLNGAFVALGGSLYAFHDSENDDKPLDNVVSIEQSVNPETLPDDITASEPTGTTETANQQSTELSKSVETTEQIELKETETPVPNHTESETTKSTEPADETQHTTLTTLPTQTDYNKNQIDKLPDYLGIVGIIQGIYNNESQFRSSLEEIQHRIAERDQLKMRQLMALTCSSESTSVTLDENGIVHSTPCESFYFCSANALTIGYGTKIEYKNGKICPEGIAVLEQLDLKRNGRSLTMDEKKQMVHTCFQRRNTHDNRAGTPLKKMSPEKQKPILFNKNDYASVNVENAYTVAQNEYADKMDKLLTANKYLGSSYLLLALSTDFAYQYGNHGVTKFDIYKVNGPITLSNLKNASSFAPDKDNERRMVRRLILEMAIQNAKDKKARGNKPATPESQAVFYMTALKKFTETFDKGIMEREEQKIVLMEQFMTLIMMQCIHNVKGEELTTEDLKTAKDQAHKLVYDELFHSDIIQQLPDQIRPITLTSAINSIKVDSLKSNGGLAIEELRNSILSQAQTRLKRYNKKNKSDHQLNTAAAYNMISAGNKTGRW